MTHLAWQSFSVYAQALLPTKYEAQWEKGFILRRGRDIFLDISLCGNERGVELGQWEDEIEVHLERKREL